MRWWFQMARVVQQLQDRPYYLYLYLNALFQKDPHLASAYADTQVRAICLYRKDQSITHCEQVKLYAEYAPRRLIDFLRASNYYNLEEVSHPASDVTVTN